MLRPAGGSSVIQSSGAAEHGESLVRHLVTETMRRVPPSVTSEELMASGRAALADARDAYDDDRDGEFACFASTRIRAALVDTLRAIDWSARGRRAPAPVSPDRVGAVDAAVAALPGDRREVIEGYFLRGRSLAELGDDLALDPPDVVELRDDALHVLRRTLAPVLAGMPQVEVSSLGSSGTGSPRISNLR